MAETMRRTWTTDLQCKCNGMNSIVQHWMGSFSEFMMVKLVVIEKPLKLVKHGWDVSHRLDAISRTEGHDGLEVGCVYLSVLRIKLLDQAPPGFQVVVSLDEAHDLSGFLVVFRKGAEVRIDRLGVGDLLHAVY